MLSQRAIRIPPSPIRLLSGAAEEARARGVHVHHLNIGQPDIEAPPEFFEGVRQYERKLLPYEPARGTRELCREWARWMSTSLSLSIEPEDLFITFGGSEALMFALAATADPGDEVIVFEPTYANYFGFSELMGVRLCGVPARLEHAFCLPPDEEIERAITPRTRAILLCNPNNPTGTVYPSRDLTRVLALCERRGLVLIADETYRELVYDGRTPCSMFHLEGDHQRVLVVDSLSKRFGLCGARIGSIITKNPHLRDAIHRMTQTRLAAPSIEQFAATYMLERVGPDFVERVRAEYQARRDILFAGLSRIPGVHAHPAEGAFYSTASFPIESAVDFGTYLLRDFSSGGATVFLTPAEGFYAAPGKGKNEARLAFVISQGEIAQAVDCLAQGLAMFLKRSA